MNILHENKVTGKEKGRKYLVYIIRLEYNLFYLRDLQVSLRGKEEEKKIMCKIVYRKPQLLIRVTNSCSGEVGTIGKTTKHDFSISDSNDMGCSIRSTECKYGLYRTIYIYLSSLRDWRIISDSGHYGH